MRTIKIVHQTYFTACGLQESWGVIIGLKRYIFYSKEECVAFQRGLYGEYR